MGIKKYSKKISDYFSELRQVDFSITKEEKKQGRMIIVDWFMILSLVYLIAHFTSNERISKYWLEIINELYASHLFNYLGMVGFFFIALFILTKCSFFSSRANRILSSTYEIGAIALSFSMWIIINNIKNLGLKKFIALMLLFTAFYILLAVIYRIMIISSRPINKDIVIKMPIHKRAIIASGLIFVFVLALVLSYFS